jgi:hypothetical protein
MSGGYRQKLAHFGETSAAIPTILEMGFAVAANALRQLAVVVKHQIFFQV